MEAESGSEPMIPLNTLFFIFTLLDPLLFEGQPRGLLLPGLIFVRAPIR